MNVSIVLKSISEEAADCRAAWAACPDAKHGAHIHHEVAVETLTEPIERRIAYILAQKPEHERALRLRLMRPTTAEDYAKLNAERATIYAKWDTEIAAAHRIVCSIEGCPFDGRTIFPEVKS